jgi:hypothetical protein
MPEAQRVSNWTQASAGNSPRCPVCGACNRPPHVFYVDVRATGHAFCTVCSAPFIVKPSAESA